jgi:transposase
MNPMDIFKILAASAVVATALYLMFFSRHALWSNNFLDEGEEYIFRPLSTTHRKPQRCPACNSGNLSGYLGAFRTTVHKIHRRPEATEVEPLVEPVLDDRGYKCHACDRFFTSETPCSDD